MRRAAQNKIAAMIAIMVLMLSALFIIAAFGIETSYAGTGYKYTVTVYSGRVGVFSGGKVWSRTYSRGERCEISPESLGLKITDERYYCRGFRIAGHDNNDTAFSSAISQADSASSTPSDAAGSGTNDAAGDTTGAASLNFTVTEDVSFKIAYGIKGKLVGFKVNYVDENGTELQSSETFYGMPGDKPVAAHRTIKGMQPETYNLGKTLSENEDDNEFTFVYRKTKKNGAKYKDLDGHKDRNIIREFFNSLAGRLGLNL